MTVRHSPVVSLAIAVWVSMVGSAGIAIAQAPGVGRPPADETPEQMAEEALTAIETGDLERAAFLIQRTRLIEPTLEKLDLAEGLFLVEKQQFPEALQKLAQYNKSESGQHDHRGFAMVGKIYSESRGYRSAIRPLEKAKDLAPFEEKGKAVRAQITIDLAVAYLGLNRTKQALDIAKEAETLAPNDADIQYRLAQIVAGAKDYPAAQKHVRRAVNLLLAKTREDPFDKEAHTTLQACYRMLVYLLRLDLEPPPENGEPYHAIAVLSREAAEVDRRASLLSAREFSLLAIEKDPTKYEWQVFVAGVEAELGGIEQAKERLGHILQNAPDNVEAAGLLSALEGRATSQTAG
ncbi:MAG: hypothetical protein ABII12_01310 [Planctomycetota bacterium]